MRRGAIALLLLVAAVTAALGHGASKGLHIHLDPDPATPGTTLEVHLDAVEPMRLIAVGLPGVEAEERELHEPARRVRLAIELPGVIVEDAVNVHAEVKTVRGRTLVASAVLRIKR